MQCLRGSVPGHQSFFLSLLFCCQRIKGDFKKSPNSWWKKWNYRNQLNTLDRVTDLVIFQHHLLVKPNISCFSILFCFPESRGLGHTCVFELFQAVNTSMKETVLCWLIIDWSLHMSSAPRDCLLFCHHILFKQPSPSDWGLLEAATSKQSFPFPNKSPVASISLFYVSCS